MLSLYINAHIFMKCTLLLTAGIASGNEFHTSTALDKCASFYLFH